MEHDSLTQASQPVENLAAVALSPLGGTLQLSQERCQSGRMGRPAKALSVLKRTVGSNPTLSAILIPFFPYFSRVSAVPTPNLGGCVAG